jgi:predicted CopG family antitoxin
MELKKITFSHSLILYPHTYTYTDMGTKTISISDDAYERLSRLKGGTGMSFSEVILKFTPPRKKLSEILKDLGTNQELADSIEKASREMRKARMREVDFDAGT